MHATVRWLGNSGIAVERAGHTLWIDPVWADPNMAQRDVDQRPPDHVVFTHGHAGHFGSAHQVLTETGARLVASDAILEHVRGVMSLDVAGSTAVAPESVHEIGPWRLWSFAVPHPPVKEGLDVGQAPPEPNLGFVLEAGPIRLLHIGDFKITPEFAHVLERLERPSLAALPFWGPRVAWTLEEGTAAVLQAARLSRARAVLPCYHFTGDLAPALQLKHAASDELPHCAVLAVEPGSSARVTGSGVRIVPDP